MRAGVVVAGTHSGCGKTLTTLGLIRALGQRGLRVQPFKAGPDYLDTGHLSRAAGRPARNLDSWLLSPESLRESYLRAMRDADIAVVEGVMGMHDGRSGQGRAASTAEIAAQLGLPVVLVLDVGGMARSAAALARGYATFDPDVRIVGVILNKAGSPNHVRLVRDALAEQGLPVLGWIPYDTALIVPERHLGLVSSAEVDSGRVADVAARHLERSLDIDRLIDLTRSPSEVSPIPGLPPTRSSVPPVILAVARDEAFQFYYEDSLDLLRAAGAEIRFFSPLKDAALPPGTQGIYLGGGYPELYGPALESNAVLRRSIRDAADGGMPVYAECGGLMYLMEEMVDAQSRTSAMCGVFEGRTVMGPGRGAFGYCLVRAKRPTLLLPEGAEVRAHEYHFSTLKHTGALFAYDVRNDLSGVTKSDGLARDNVLASYVHLHFASAGFLAERFVATGRHFGSTSGAQPPARS